MKKHKTKLQIFHRFSDRRESRKERVDDEVEAVDDDVELVDRVLLKGRFYELVSAVIYR
jgi:hypothetical protein